MSITCQVWDIKHIPDQDLAILTCKIWTPCKVGECLDDPVQAEYLPGFIVQGYYSPKLGVIAPHRLVLAGLSKWAEVSKYYLLQEYPPFLFYVPEWDLQTRSPGELFMRACNQI